MTRTTPKPMRPGLPLFGSYLEFRRDPLEFCMRLAREQGDMAFCRMGWLTFVQLNRPEWIQQLLTKESQNLHKSVDFKELSLVLGKGLVTSEDALWRRQRRLIQPAFHNERVRCYAPSMLACANAALSRWRPGAELNLTSELSRLTLEIVGHTLFGANMLQNADVVAQALGVFMDRFEATMTRVPLPIAWPLPQNRGAHRAVRTLDAVVTRLVRERRAGGHAGDDLLGWLLAARDEQGGIDDRQLRDELVTLMLAGHETTALALTWALVLIAEHPEVERKLTEEITKALGRRPVQAEDESRLVYVRQVVEEALRLRPPVWSTGREAMSDIVIDGQRIAKGTQILVTPWVTHRDPRYFPEPERFDPGRWSADRRSGTPRFAYFPFGGGPRVCVGMHFAMLEATLLLTSILQRFQIELIAGQDIGLQPAVTLRPRPAVRVRVHARHGPARGASDAASQL